MLGWVATMCLIAYVHRGCISVLDKKLQLDLHLSDTDLSYIHSAFFWSYAVLQIPGAWAAERWGVRRILTIMVVIWTISTTAMGLCQGTTSLIIARLGMGLGQAGAFPCGVISISKWFPPTQRGMPSGVMTSFMLIGLAVGQASTGFMLGGVDWRGFQYSFDWREIFVWLSLMGYAWALGFYSWFRDNPQDHPRVNAEELKEIWGTNGPPENLPRAAGARGFAPWGVILASSSIWLVFIQHALRALWTAFLMSLLPKYLREVFHATPEQAGYFAGGIVAVGVLGNASGGVLADLIIRRTGSLQLGRQGLAVGMLLGAGIMVLLPQFTSNIWLAAVFLSLSNVLAGCGGPAAYAITIDIGGPHVSKVFSSMNMMGNFGAALSPLLVNWFVDVPELGGWRGVPSLFATIYILAAASWWGIKTRCLFTPEQEHVSSAASTAQ